MITKTGIKLWKKFKITNLFSIAKNECVTFQRVKDLISREHQEVLQSRKVVFRKGYNEGSGGVRGSPRRGC